MPQKCFEKSVKNIIKYRWFESTLIIPGLLRLNIWRNYGYMYEWLLKCLQTYAISFVIYKVCLQIYQVWDVCEIFKTFILSAISLNVSVVLMKDRNWRKSHNLWDPNSLSDRLKAFLFPFFIIVSFTFFKNGFCMYWPIHQTFAVLYWLRINEGKLGLFSKKLFQQSRTK